MFADPQSVTIDAVAQSLPRVTVGDHSASYTKDDETVSLSISHQTTKAGRVRRLARLDIMKVAPDPFRPADSREVRASYQFVIDEPEDGAFSNTEGLANAKGLIGFLSDANVTKLLAGES